MEDPKPELAAVTKPDGDDPKPTTEPPTTTAPKPQDEELSKDNQRQPVPLTTDSSEPSKAPSPTGRTPSQSLEIDKVQPEDFEGEVNTNNEIPSPETLKKIEDYVVLDRHGKTHTFKSLYTGPNVARRVLIVFVRHFFCGNCQEFLRSLSESITPDALLRLPISTFITVVGCGDPALIDMYVRETNCPFPVYTDPKRALFDALGMSKTLAMGAKPAYMRKSMTRSVLDSVVQGLKQIPTGRALKSGDQRQVGGEFLFEPLELATPVTTPQDERRPLQPFEEREREMHTGAVKGEEEKRISWCHRMKTTRDHAEIPELMEVLGLDGSGRDRERWEKALETRKGTGLSMASEMSKLSAEKSRS